MREAVYASADYQFTLTTAGTMDRACHYGMYLWTHCHFRSTI